MPPIELQRAVENGRWSSQRVAARFRIAGAASGSSYDPHVCSGIVAALFQALDHRGLLARRVDVSPSGRQRAGLAIRTFHPVRTTWKARFRRAVYETQSRNCETLLANDDLPDVVLEVFREFQPRGLPYWLLLDTTDALRRAAGRPTPFSPEGLGFSTEHALYAGATHIFTTATEPRTSLVRDYEIAEGRVTVVRAGVNIEYPATSDIPLTQSRRQRGPVVLFVGRDFDRKGGKELLEAFARVRSIISEARLKIAGVTLPHDPPGVMSVGDVRNRNAVAELYRSASVFCLPSHFEPTGMSVIEAMAFALPVVGTRVGGIAEAVSEGESGLLVEPGNPQQLADALARLLSNPQEAATMGRMGRRRVDTELNWDAVVDRMMDSVADREFTG